MQLSNKGSIAAALASATCALLGQSQAHAETDSSVLKDWKFDTAILYYGETDRVSLAEGVVSATKTNSDDSIFNVKLVLDTLTGASANGAVAQPTVQTFSRPSGKDSYQVAAGDTPLDDTFRDTRVQVAASWMQPFADTWRGTAGFNVSREYDYMSLGVNGLLEKDLFQRNTTLSAGLSYQFDSIDPVGGKPTPLSSMIVPADDDYDDEFEGEDDDHGAKNGSDDKTTLDMLFGVTQVITRRMLMQFNYGLSIVDGYTTDPYKVLSVINTNGVTQDIVYENRPDSRTKHSFFWQTKYALDNGVVDVSYRYATDDWEIDSHTIDSRLRFNLSGNSYIQPHIRYYQQSAADFYQPYLNQSADMPMYASADYRVGEMTAYTVGLKYGRTLENGHEWAVRAEYYQQDPKNAGFEQPGVLADLDLYPSVKAVILQFNYHF
ncbi:DUF3570 domain-containing protein [Alteromonas sp. AMM-1]|uniref:DUF3570 domain-containing protein n=1 Tax=Alteromonas sp. AMM-1 TaxID=3394233 RepID=UPI0039A60FA0